MYISNPTAFSTADQTLKAKKIIFIDSNVQDYHYLVQAAVAKATIKIINSEQDGIQQITESLAKDNYSEINIIAHGSPGCLYLGNRQLSLDTLEYYTPQVKTWSVASISIYGCNVAAGDAGVELIEKLYQITGAEIAASAHKIGHKALGGTWKLDVKTSDFYVSLPFDSRVKTEWNYILAAFESQPAFYQVIGLDTTNDNTTNFDQSQLNILNPLTGEYEPVGYPTDFVYNAAGYNPQDKFIYGIIQQGTKAGTLIKVSADGSTEELGLKSPSGVIAADIDNNNNLWVRTAPQTLLKINLKTLSTESITFSGGENNNVSDIVYIPSGGQDFFYGVDQGKLYTWNATTETIVVSETLNSLAKETYGAAWTDKNKNLYVSSN